MNQSAWMESGCNTISDEEWAEADHKLQEQEPALRARYDHDKECFHGDFIAISLRGVVFCEYCGWTEPI